MQRNREIRKSIRDRISDIFTSPPSGSGFSAFHVYTETDYRNDSHVPAAPYIYLIDSFLLPTSTKLPIVVLETKIRLGSFELGNRSGRHVTAWIHCFGRNRGERDDLAGFIGDYFGNSFSIKTYASASDTGTAVETVQLYDRIDIEDMSISGNDVEFSGQALFWNRVSLEFDCKL